MSLNDVFGTGLSDENLAAIKAAVSVSANVLPAVGIVADRSPGVTVNAFVGETTNVSITLYATDGTTPVALVGRTLVVVFETRSGLDIATIEDESIAVTGDDYNVIGFSLPSSATSAERTLIFSLRDSSAPSTVYLQGLLHVQRAALADE